MDCTVRVDEPDPTAEYSYPNTPFCGSTDCTHDEIEEAFDDVLLPALKQIYASQGLYCDIDATFSSTSKLFHGYSSLILASLAAATIAILL